MESSIIDLLKELQCVTEETDLDNWCERLCKFYKANSRHSYAEITKYILSQDGGVDYVYRIVPILEKTRDGFSGTDADMYKNIGKLIDHIKLELIRLSYIRENVNQMIYETYLELNNQQIDDFNSLYLETQRKSDEIRDYLEESIKLKAELQTSMKSIETQVMNVSNIAKKAEIKVKNAQAESITILGIFAAIVLAFTSGLAYSTSVLQNIGNASIYKIIVIACGIALVLIHIIYILVYFIMVLNDSSKERGYASYMKKIDVAVFIIVAVTFLLWLLDLNQLRQVVRDLIYSGLD